MILVRLLAFGTALFVAVAFNAPVQFCLRRLGLIAPADRLQVAISRLLCAALRLQVHRHGRRSDAPALVIANHVSWTDILVLGSSAPFCFLAKSDVAGWPLLGAAVRAHGTLFVSRRRTRQLPAVNRAMAAELAKGRSVVLFAEGTTSNGARLEKFHSGHVGALRDWFSAEPSRPSAPVVPVALAYTRCGGLAVDSRDRTALAWEGDTTLWPHLLWLLRHGPVRCDLVFGEPLAFRRGDDRKAVTAAIHKRVHRIFSTLVSGRGIMAADKSVIETGSAIWSPAMIVLRPDTPSGPLS